MAMKLSAAVLVLVLASAVGAGAQACLGLAPSPMSVVGTYVSGGWASDPFHNVQAYGVEASSAQGLRSSAGGRAYTGTVVPAHMEARLTTEERVFGADVRYSRSVVDSYLDQQVVCLNVGGEFVTITGENRITEFGVPLSISFGLALGTPSVAVMPFGSMGARIVYNDGVSARPDSSAGIALLVGPLQFSAAVSHNLRYHQRGVLRVGTRF